MKILFLTGLAFFVSAYVGWGLAGLLRRDRSGLCSIMILPFGYALAQVLFYPAYFLLKDATAAVVAVLGTATVLNAIHAYRYFIRSRATPNAVGPTPRTPYPAYLTAGLVVIFAALPYLYSGFGNYWHSASEDIFDGLNGRDAYLRGYLVEKKEPPTDQLQLKGALALQQLVKAGISPRTDVNFFRQRYAHDLGRLQYSSLAFWSVALRSPLGMDVFLLQALLNLGLFVLGIFFFAETVLNQPRLIAGVAAVMASVGNFYLTTYINGHEGSQMYNAVAPFLLCCLLSLIERKEAPGAWLVIPGILVVFVAGAYPYPLPFLVAPVVAYAAVVWLVRQKNAKADAFADIRRLMRQPHFIASVVVVLLVGFAVAWFVLEPMRLRAMSQFRSWGTMLNHVGLLQFWGLWPSNLPYIGIPLSWLNQQLYLKILSLVFSAFLVGVAIYGYARLLANKVAFLLVWLPVWVVFFVFMRFAVYDSYYLYKFFYINAWLIIIPAVMGVFALWASRHRALRYIGGVSLLIWLGANLANDANAFCGMAQKAYNSDYAAYRRIAEIPRDLLVDTFIDVSLNDHYDVIRQTLAAIPVNVQQDKAASKYLLEMESSSDVLPKLETPAVWRANGFVLRKTPATNVLELASYWAPESVENPALGRNQSFRWISDARNGYMVLDIHKRDSAANFLYVCAESGPSVDYHMVNVRVTDADNRSVGVIGVGPYACYWLSIEHFRAPFTFLHDVTGKEISVVEPRKLVYRVFAVGVTDQIYGDRAIAFPYTTQDIIPDNASAAGGGLPAGLSLHLGQGWEAYEYFNGAHFRWAGTSAKLMLKDGREDGIVNLAVDLERGPSLGRDSFTLEVFDDSGRALFTSPVITGRKTVVLPLPYRRDVTSVYTLHAKSENLPVARDSRILNYRVFSIKPAAAPAVGGLP